MLITIIFIVTPKITTITIVTIVKNDINIDNSWYLLQKQFGQHLILNLSIKIKIYICSINI